MKHMLSRREKSHTPLDDLDEISIISYTPR